MKKEAIAELLPAIFQQTIQFDKGEILATMLHVMERLHDPVESTLENLHLQLDPDFAESGGFLTFLAHWVGLGPLVADKSLFPADDPIQQNRLRNLIKSAVDLAQQRGTRVSLINFLQTATGQTGFRVVNHRFYEFHLVIQYPESASSQQDLMTRIIELEKPVYTTYEMRPVTQIVSLNADHM